MMQFLFEVVEEEVSVLLYNSIWYASHFLCCSVHLREGENDCNKFVLFFETGWRVP